MAAASISQSGSTAASLALDDYSLYSHLTDDELLQLAIERSLKETHNNNNSAPTSTPPPHPVTRTYNQHSSHNPPVEYSSKNPPVDYSSHNPPVDYSSPNPPAERPPDPYGLISSTLSSKCADVPLVFSLYLCSLKSTVVQNEKNNVKRDKILGGGGGGVEFSCVLIGCCVETGRPLMGQSVGL